MKLPPLPEPAMTERNPYLGYENPYGEQKLLRWYSPEQMIEHGRACSAAERERCAQVCDDISNRLGWRTERVIADECADTIRALKDKT